jgi:hypothetical protein
MKYVSVEVQLHAFITLALDRAMAQAVSRRSLVAEARVRALTKKNWDKFLS